jgi:hypothetical protein
VRAVARGALMVALLPVLPETVSAADVKRALERRGIRIHVRSVQRDLEDMPASIVKRVGRTSWARAA